MLKETDIQISICDYLALKKYFFWRQNTSPTVQKNGDKWHFRRMPAYSMNGVPDILLIKDGQFIGLEIKKPKGVQSANQKEFEKNCKQAGGKYYIVTSIDEVIAIGL